MLQEVLTFFKSNPMLAGFGGATAAGYVIAHIKDMPGRIWHLLKEQFTTELSIWSEDAVFTDLDRWLALHPSTNSMRRLAVTEWYEERRRSDEFALTPGAGTHVIWRDKRPFFIHRRINEAKEGGGMSSRGRRSQTLTISTPGRSQIPIRRLMEEIRRQRRGLDEMCVYTWSGHEHALADRRPKRAMDTVYCTDTLKQSLIDDILKFQASKESYRLRGIPYRRTYMFEGKPGTGKTTMIFALASLIERPVLIVQAATIANDRELICALNAGEDHVVVIEEIDSLRATETRETAEHADLVGEAGKSGITLSGLLEALDGLSARDGRILFLTTNKPEVLDAALLRPGRIDVREHFDVAGLPEAMAMFARFYPDSAGDLAFVARITPLLPMAHADLQSFLLANYG